MNEQQNQLTPPSHQLPNQRIPGDIVNKATTDLPDNQRSAIRRLHAQYTEQALTIEETAELIGYTGAVVSQLFRGKYDGALDNVVDRIEKYFDLMDKRNQGRRLEFIVTAMTQKIWRGCDAAREFQKFVFIFGESQIGKTESLENYAITHNHGSTIYSSVPSGGNLTNYLHELARRLRIGENMNTTRLRERIKGAFDDRMLLIVDEAHQCIPRTGRSDFPTQTIEFVREIYNEKKCGVVISATNIFRDAMQAGPVEKILRQTKRRSLCTIQLPATPTQEDLNAFAAGHGLPPSEGAVRTLEKRMVETEALGRWLSLLRMAAKIANQRKEKMKWSHVLAAEAGLKELEGKNF